MRTDQLANIEAHAIEIMGETKDWQMIELRTKSIIKDHKPSFTLHTVTLVNEQEKRIHKVTIGQEWQEQWVKARKKKKGPEAGAAGGS